MDDDFMKGLKVQLTRAQVQLMSTSIPEKVVADLWAKLLGDYPQAKHFLLLAGEDNRKR